MIRGWLCLAVIMLAAALASPTFSATSHSHSEGIQSLTPLPNPDPLNVTGAAGAFNYTLSSANIFTNATAKETPAVNSTQFKWFSTINNTKTGSPIQGTTFNITVVQASTPSVQQVAWNLTVPKSNCSTCITMVSFTLYGTLTKNASENFTLTNSTTTIESGIFQGNDTTPRSICTLPSPPINATVCGPTVQLNILPKYIASTLTLTFKFGWTTTAAALKASIGEVLVESLDNTPKSSATNLMTLSSSTSNIVSHNATFTQVHYNSTNSVKPWSNAVLNIYYASGYKITQVKLNQTTGPPISILPSYPFERESCNNGVVCTQSLIAINMSDTYSAFIHNSTAYVGAVTANSLSPLTTLSGGIATKFFTAGDQIGVKVVNTPSIKNSSTTLQTGSLTITFPPALLIPSSTVPTATGGVYTFLLPTSCGFNNQLCSTKQPWTVTATFSSLYDIGNATGSFKIDLLQVASFTSTGGNNALSVQGTLEYGNLTAAPGVNTTLFAIDRGTPINTPTTNNQTVHSSTQLYISSVTLVNGVFAENQSLTMLFTVVNPNPTQAYNATVTIEHDWPGPQRHNMTASIFLGLGDGMGGFTFTNTTARTYKATITFTSTGVQVAVTSLPNNPTPKTLTLTQGTSPVVPNRPHAGLFNITVTSLINSQAQTNPSWLMSPTYAYVPNSLAPSRYLYASPVFLTGTGGSFAQTISSTNLLGAKNLTVFVLARDASGIIVVNNLPTTGFVDSTSLVATADSLGPVAKGGSATATLHLTSNSTQSNGITEVITVILVVQGNGLPSPKQVGMKRGVAIKPGASVTVPLSFTAPSNTGSYTLTFSSPEYGGILTSQTLQVTILSSNLQLLIPAAIGVVAAIIILGVYLVQTRHTPTEEEVEEEAKPKGPSPKPKPTPSANPPTKSLTRTADAWQ